MKNRILTILFLLVVVWFIIPIPNLDLAYSKVVYDKNGRLLSAKIADDEQWRFPVDGELPVTLEKSIVYFEDEYFYKHPGVNPISIGKAVYQNWQQDKVVRGGSTITMQVMRMYYGNRKRTYWQKVKELLGAVKLDLLYSKKDILKMWAEVAPFGGNTVGASTASWRYFNRNLNQLSIAEYATLAVLPNTPSKIHMTKNVESLRNKRNQLLHKLYQHQEIDSIDLQLALTENIDFEQKNVPQQSLHFMNFLSEKYPDQFTYHSTIDPMYQQLLNETLSEYSDIYQFDGIQNAAATIIDVQKNEVVAYVGNTKFKGKAMRYVDCVQAPRSYGSLLKPLLYAYAIDEGYFLPNENIKDIPTNLNGFIPKNFDRKFRGTVPMDQMVSRSLNVPAVRVLNYVGVASFHHLLKNELDFSHVHNDANHHGLSLILGGAECSMWEMSRVYKGLMRNQLEMNNAFNPTKCLQNEQDQTHNFSFHPTAAWHTMKAMMSVNRPKEEQHFVKMGGQNVAWKTGTSYGHRDAWAIGANERFVVAVWVGNEDGEGVYNLTGVKKAGPILFRIMRHLDQSNQLIEPIAMNAQVEACSESGMLKGHLCTHTVTQSVPHFSHQLRHCNHHEVVNTNQDGEVQKDTLFFLKPTINYYYAQHSGHDLSLPSKNEMADVSTPPAIVYPEENAVIFVPKKLNQAYSSVALKANTAAKKGTLFWFLNGTFVEKTEAPHHINVDLKEGEYALQINDDLGNKDALEFSVVRR